MGLCQRVFAANRRAATRLYRFFPQGADALFADYVDTVVAQAAAPGVSRILDVGSGSQCCYAESLSVGKAVVGLDLTGTGLRKNWGVRHRVQANVEGALPFADGSFDLVTSRSALEHFANVPAALSETGRVLRKGGRAVHLLPLRHAPFAILNRALPNALSRVLLRWLHPDGHGLGHVSYYCDCTPSRMHRLLEMSGMQVLECHLSYAQSSYFGCFLPVFLLSACYEWCVARLGATSLAAYALYVAERRCGEQRPCLQSEAAFCTGAEGDKEPLSSTTGRSVCGERSGGRTGA